MRVVRATFGIIAILPAAFLAAFYAPRLLWRFEALAPFARVGYRSGLLLLACSFIFCFLSPLLVGFSSLFWRASVPRHFFWVAAGAAIITFTIFYLDPMGRIHAFVAD